MIRNILFISIFTFQAVILNAQLKLDSFIFRNDIDINYTLPVRNNDTDKDLLRIISVTKLGPNASKYILNISLDSLVINVFSTDNTLDTATFIYKTIHKNFTIDSTYVFFEKKAISTTMYPGDANRDNLVNHLDLFPIGLFYNKMGYPRHNDDTAISFSPKKTSNWFFQTNGLNASNADVDGNGIVNDQDLGIYQANFGKSNGNYLPTLSGNSPTVQLKLSIADTVDLFKDTGRIYIPILINSPSKINAYGIGYSYTVRVLIKNNAPLDTFYPYTKFNNTNIWNELESKFIIDKTSYKEHVNVAYVRINQSNGEMDPQAGVIEVVTDEVLIGITNQQDVSFVNILLKEVSLVDKDLNTIPISPISKRIYFRKAKLSIQNTIESTIKVYPTLIDNSLSIEKLSSKSQMYSIYNVLGQEVLKGELNKLLTYIDVQSMKSGVYYLKLDGILGAVKLQKL